MMLQQYQSLQNYTKSQLFQLTEHHLFPKLGEQLFYLFELIQCLIEDVLVHRKDYLGPGIVEVPMKNASSYLSRYYRITSRIGQFSGEKSMRPNHCTIYRLTRSQAV